MTIIITDGSILGYILDAARVLALLAAATAAMALTLWICDKISK